MVTSPVEVTVNEDLKHIKARLDAAAPGPWRALTGEKQRAHEHAARMGLINAAPAFPMMLANDQHVIGELSPWTMDEDRALIVNARRDIEHLYDEVLRARELLRAVLYDCEEDAVTAARDYLTRVGFER
jgi:hypothetical protein